MAIEDEDKRHKREQEKLRRKRKALKENKSESAKAKERKRREHAQRVLAAQKLRTQNLVDSPSEDLSSISAFQNVFDKRSDGFLIEMKFRNAPPRPPVGPFFVGPGFEEALMKKWVNYRPANSIELNHSMQLHDEKHLIASCAIIPSSLDANHYKQLDNSSNMKSVTLDPADEKLLSWTGSLGDTGAEELAKMRDVTRANATGAELDSEAPSSSKRIVKIELANKEKKDSRVLAEKNQRWMKKTTYLSNDQSKSVHQFKSQAVTKMESKVAIDSELAAFKENAGGAEAVEKSFNAVNKGARSRQHPTKRGVTVVCDIPVFPDFPTWGLSYSNVIIDNLPKGSDSSLTPDQLRTAIIGDVDRKGVQSKRMECNLLVPTNIIKDENVDNGDSVKNEKLYTVSHQYDLDVIPLTDGIEPDVNYLFFVDEKNQTVTYHPLQSRVQLSTGRIPASNIAPMNVLKRELTPDEVDEMQERAAEVDEELAFNRQVKSEDQHVDGI